LGFKADAMRDTPVLAIEDAETSYYLRMSAEDKPGVLAEVSEVFAAHSISLEAVLQKEPAEGANLVNLILLSQQVQEKNMNVAIKEVEALAAIQGEVVRIRMEHLG
ncbi:MAG: ACT domain-containing protein, partial [Gammaproteobacteria bacterium]|nr:ACT domain-containing protein [Gammaproteobacteria bacterium]